MTFFNHKKSKDIIVVIVIQKLEITSSTQCLILANFIFKEQKNLKHSFHSSFISDFVAILCSLK
ncbi:hypothetical protein DRF62_17675 [Chryseobacterium piscium]|uniref:Uncharacterized protein n=1 Tax=Chryseobacterium piscium TaxID=333702 RepID=A0A3D9BCQ0_9FLAO|nr:hypothetical protein DRF62_17675 [Chryseobacterium piscium]